ncbi:unnamed protein product [Mytilus edulis]|uniref:Uncharacterized protein n=1 Tax=Mytilus edulis TaxID=6550 RepID=A0A8S3RGK7_MYTED|nr:unnamed protein product [Mytilus edulis]
MGEGFSKDDEDDRTGALFQTIRRDRFQLATDLISKGAGVNCMNNFGNTQLIQTCRNNRTSTRTGRAVESDRERFVSFLISNDCDMSKYAIYGWTALMNQYIRVGMCIPSDATFNLFTKTPLRRLKLVDWTEVQSIEELDSDTLGDRYFWDKSIGIPVDGGWSSWSAFEKCSVTCGGGKQSQYRSCKNPATANGGTDCVGESVNSVSCNKHPCPVNGKFSDWGQWSSCIANSGCQGYRERERSCNTPAPQHGGIHCTGSVKKQEACNNCN